MPIYSPSQYDCNNMQYNDTIVIKPRNFFYKFIRKYFLKDKIKLKIRKNWNEPIQYETYYQEDCIIIKSYEISCVEYLDKQVPCILSIGKHNKTLNTFYINQVIVTLYNIQFIFKNGLSLTFPFDSIIKAQERNKLKLNTINKMEALEESLKFIKHKGKYFRDKVIENNIDKINIQYCNICR